MTLFFSSSITDAQAQSYSAATDQILFNQGESATSVRFTTNALLGIYDLTFDGHTFHFSSALLGENDFSFSDHSTLIIGTAHGDMLFGTTGVDALFGGDGPDNLGAGGAGADLMNGGGGQDYMTGGGAFTTFVFDPGDSAVNTPDEVDGWFATDLLEFSGLLGKGAGLYEESTAGSFAEASAFANREIASGAADYVVVQFDSDSVMLFVDSRNDNGVADDAVVIDTSLGLISAANIKGATATQSPPPPPSGGPISLVEPTLPDPPTTSGASTFITVSGGFAESPDLSQVQLLVTDETPTGIAITSSATFGGAPYHPVTMTLVGNGLTYDSDGDPLSGTITRFMESVTTPVGGVLRTVTIDIDNTHIPVQQLIAWAESPDPNALTNGLYGGADLVNGGGQSDVLRGFGGNDTLNGQPGSDSIFGGDGNDLIYGRNAVSAGVVDPADQNYLRGEAGDDYIVGGGGFDDINGNMGNDTATGGVGDDWVVGGKDNDLLFGDSGNDIVWGNLGSDTLVGGDGADQVRGGQGDDVLFGGAGNDFVSGDRGNDTITGGAGADLFHDSQDASIDRVIDFNLAEGDKVMLDPGTTYTVSQVGADTVIDFGAGNQMILVGVQMSTLPPGTIFFG